ncbi:MAG: phosphatidate cytidylyltransferase [Anaerolineales bacterium]|nr:phosphatidate cytidylyltransferase [Anaerolineales bacterium]
MLVNRLLVAIVLLPLGIAAIALGGLAYAAVIMILLGLAAWEYVGLFRAGGWQPAGVVVIGGTLALLVGRGVDGFTSAPWILSLIFLVSMAYHLVAYERGRDQAGTDFAITLAGILYLGWIGGYFISLRNLPDGKWWVLVALPAVWLADSGAYVFGTRFGRHKITPRLSPKKSWEGYLGGIPVAVLGTAGLAALWAWAAGPGVSLTAWSGAALGLAMGVLTILGDLGESMLKRQVGMKDSSNLLPGHGGFLDRVDSWLWASVIGYYLIVWFFL